MKTQNKSNMLKDLFYFRKSKLITFIILVLIFLNFAGKQDAILGNITISILLTSIMVIYLFLSIIWFAFLGKKHFIISLLLLALLVFLGWYTNFIDHQKKERIENECLNENNTRVRNIEVMRCMKLKGIKFYR